MEVIPGIFNLTTGTAPESLRGYNKMTSVYNVLSLGLPSQRGVVVTYWNSDISKWIDKFLQLESWDFVTIRTDKRNESGNYMRGGYLVSVNDVKNEVQKILEMDRIVAILKPVNKYENLYGVNICIGTEKSLVLLEVVGHGFDISDINRGDISPHERILIHVTDQQVTRRIAHREIVDQSQFRETVNLRLAKIGREAISRGWMGTEELLTDDLYIIGLQYLRAFGNTLLLDSINDYKPLPDSFLRKLVSYIRDLPWKLPNLKRERECVISTSIVGSMLLPEFIFWDIVYPSRKYCI